MGFNPAFTLIELIFALIIVGILAAVAVPRFSGMRNNAKITSELSTASSVQTVLDACHGEWVINESAFTCGKDIQSDDPTAFDSLAGYPLLLGTDNAKPLNRILKNGDNVGWVIDAQGYYRGPASNDGVAAQTPDTAGKPDSDDYWEYNASNGEFKLVDN